MGWLLRLVTGAPTGRGPDKERKGVRGPRPEKVTGADGCVTPLTAAMAHRLGKLVAVLEAGANPCL